MNDKPFDPEILKHGIIGQVEDIVSAWHCSECGQAAEARHSGGVDPLSGELVVTPDYYICVNKDCKFYESIIPNFRY